MFRLIVLLAAAAPLIAQTGEQTLLVVNRRDEASRQIAEYYRPRRSVPMKNVCVIDAPPDEEISWDVYVGQIENPISRCLQNAGLRESVLYIVTTMGVPLKISGGGSGYTAEYGSVDSELALLYGKLKGMSTQRAGGVPNPFFMQRDAPFRHPQFPIYLVTRLAANDIEDVKSMIDRSLAARNRGKFVIDAGPGKGDGDNWLRTAAMLLPRDRVKLDDTPNVLYRQTGVIGYASWGSNDGGRHRRWLGFQWLPGAVVTEYVSTGARTMRRPPENWMFTTWDDRGHFFAGSPQGLSADYIHEGAAAVAGNVYEPYLNGCPRPVPAARVLSGTQPCRKLLPLGALLELAGSDAGGSALFPG